MNNLSQSIEIYYNLFHQYLEIPINSSEHIQELHDESITLRKKFFLKEEEVGNKSLIATILVRILILFSNPQTIHLLRHSQSYNYS